MLYLSNEAVINTLLYFIYKAVAYNTLLYFSDEVDVYCNWNAVGKVNLCCSVIKKCFHFDSAIVGNSLSLK